MHIRRHVYMILGSYDQSAHEGIANYAGKHGWHLNVSALKSFNLPKNWKGDGIITSLNNSSSLEKFVRNAGLPTVDLSIWREDIDLPRVAADNTAIGQLGAAHFIEMGHQHFAWFSLSSDPVSRARYNAYSQYLSRKNLSTIRLDTGRTQDSIYMLERIQQLPKPCAIYCKSDYDAAWLSNLCLEANVHIPEEIAILGADDNRLICENQPVPLSSVQHDLRKIGYEGAAMLDQLMKGEAPAEKRKLIPPRGIAIRQSTDAIAVTDPLIREVLQFLNSRYQRSIGTDEVSRHFNLSRRSLELRFRQSMHTSIRDYLIQIRIKEAKRQLTYTDDTIETIAAQIGFCHASHLSNTFKKAIGCSPHKYRTQHK